MILHLNYSLSVLKYCVTCAFRVQKLGNGNTIPISYEFDYVYKVKLLFVYTPRQR